MHKSLPHVLFLLLSLWIGIRSEAQFRKYSNEFLNIGAGARGLAMGSAQIASVNDASAGYWNPAGLLQVKDHPEGMLMHADYFSGIAKYDMAALAIPVKDQDKTLGVTLLRFAVDDIPNTLFLVEPDGSLNYNNIQSFSSADYALLLSYAQSIPIGNNRKIAIGANTKIIHRNVGRFANAWGFGLDAGVQYSGNRFQLAAMARDVTSTFNAWSFSFTDREKQVLYLTQNDIPVKSTELTAPRLVLGGNYEFLKRPLISMMAEANLSMTFDGMRNALLSSSFANMDPSLGLEASIKDQFYVRAGITNFQRALSDGDTLNQKRVWIFQPSAGAGVRLKQVSLDYAFTNLANQNSPLYTHVFSIRIRFVKKNQSQP